MLNNNEIKGKSVAIIYKHKEYDYSNYVYLLIIFLTKVFWTYHAKRVFLDDLGDYSSLLA